MSDAASTCFQCAEPVAADDAFCENCGAQLMENAVAAPAEPVAEPVLVASTAPCRDCGGVVADDGFCSVCGKRAPSARDHWQEAPADWVGGVCDKGIVHARNEDAMALAALADRTLAVLVVCDGVTSAPDSDRAALAAARIACSTLTGTTLPTSAGVAATVSHWSAALTRSCLEANAAAVGVARSLGNPNEPPSCTFIAAVLHGDVVTLGWCGDSRAYWLPDAGEPVQLMLDHSLGTEMIQGGMSRAEAEADSSFHTITRWLGADSVDSTPDLASLQLRTAGWLLLCSDGLWNYASPAVALQSLVHEQIAAGTTAPVAIADELVRFANDQGGHDNITAALARYEPSLR